MSRTPQDVTEAELAVLQKLWDGRSATIRQLTEHLYPEGGTAHYATVQKLLERLEAKGFVARERRPAGHVFSPAIDREELIGRRLRAVAEKLCHGSLTPLLTSLVRTGEMSPRERQELRDLIEQLDRKPKTRGRERA